MSRALITGVSGQDGSYLAEFLLDKGYDVYGMVRRTSSDYFERIEHLRKRIKIIKSDLLEQISLLSIIEDVRPDEIYNLAAQSFVHESWRQPLLTAEFTALGVTRILEAIRLIDKNIKFYQASSSEMFGKAVQIPQNEETPFYPRSPYGVAKVYGHWITVNYRESYNLHACSGILFNHESPRRGKEFVTRKVTDTAARIKLGQVERLKIGNIKAKRDWGFAKDYVEAMWMMLQQDEAEDFVVATEEAHSVEELLETAFSHLDLDWREFTDIDEHLKRPAEVDHLIGDCSKARNILKWESRTGFQDLIRMMVDSDLKFYQENRAGHDPAAR